MTKKTIFTLLPEKKRQFYTYCLLAVHVKVFCFQYDSFSYFYQSYINKVLIGLHATQIGT